MMEKKSRRFCSGIVLVSCLLFLLPAYGEERPVTFHLSCEKGTPNSFKMASQDTKKEFYFEKIPCISVNDIDHAKIRENKPTELSKKIEKMTGRPVAISDSAIIYLNGEGRKKLYKVTSQNIEKHIGVVFDGKLLIAPRIVVPISDGTLQIAGKISRTELESLVKRINEFKARAKE